mmetsp:Transcript_1078/g.2528  ORF Transcript_1078/g.2528 Transcript_1078/m.2528 type:complete len:264 (-) Transcript_1078:49-840(-)
MACPEAASPSAVGPKPTRSETPAAERNPKGAPERAQLPSVCPPSSEARRCEALPAEPCDAPLAESLPPVRLGSRQSPSHTRLSVGGEVIEFTVARGDNEASSWASLARSLDDASSTNCRAIASSSSIRFMAQPQANAICCNSVAAAGSDKSACPRDACLPSGRNVEDQVAALEACDVPVPGQSAVFVPPSSSEPELPPCATSEIGRLGDRPSIKSPTQAGPSRGAPQAALSPPLSATLDATESRRCRRLEHALKGCAPKLATQ